MVTLLRLVSFLIVFGIIVLVHEFGHFIAARFMNIRVEVFSFGIGKRLFGRKWRNTDFRISLIPVGGYVRLGGEEEYDSKNRQSDDLFQKNRAQRFFTFIMGSIMNILLALFIITIINMTGVKIESYKSEKPIIGFVEKESPADQAGLRVKDLILSLNDKQVTTWKDVELVISTNPKENLRIMYSRDGNNRLTLLKVSTVNQVELGYAGFYWNQCAQIEDVKAGSPAQKAGLQKDDLILAVNDVGVENYFYLREIIRQSPKKKLIFLVKRADLKKILEVIPAKNENGEGYIGFSPKITEIKTRFGFAESLKRSFDESIQLVALTFNAFKRMIRGKLSPKNLSGPIEIARFSQQALSTGLSNFFMLIAFISLQLGIVNLFPIPGLDGGHLIILMVESVIRRDLNQKLKTTLIYIGFFLLIGLMLFVILNDISKALPKGWKSLFPFLK